MLGKDCEERRKRYDFLGVGSGYGGAILAARISAPIKDAPKTLCLLERGKEWPVGTFPDTLSEVSAAARHSLINTLGLYDFLAFSDIAIIQGSGLGGTSLINANVAIIPDEEVFRQSVRPPSISLESLLPYRERAARVLAARPHRKAADLLKVKALDRRARQIGSEAFALNITVNFALEGKNPCGAEQKPCIDWGDCVIGCDVGAKNTLYMNYLPLAGNNGAHIFTQTLMDWAGKASARRVEGSREASLHLPHGPGLRPGQYDRGRSPHPLPTRDGPNPGATLRPLRDAPRLQRQEYLLHGFKYMQKNQEGGLRGMKEIIHDYTTLYCRLREVASGKEMGGALPKFKTFESLEVAGSFASFLKSFRVTGTDKPVLKAEGVTRFLAFTDQFVLREYDP